MQFTVVFLMTFAVGVQFVTLKDPKYPKIGQKLYSYVCLNRLLPYMAFGDAKGSFEFSEVRFWRFRPNFSTILAQI